MIPVQFAKVRFVRGDRAIEADVKECFLEVQADEQGPLPLYDINGDEYPYLCWGVEYTNPRQV